MSELVVPEYESKHPFVRRLFHRRLRTAICMDDQHGAILDAGCGDGYLGTRIHNREIIGIDISPEKCVYPARYRSVVGGALNALPFSDSRFHTIFCLDVLEHIPDINKATSELARVLAPGGCLILSIPTESFLYRVSRLLTSGRWNEPSTGKDEHHYHTSEGVLRAIRAHFIIDRKRVLPYRWFPLFLIVRCRKR